MPLVFTMKISNLIYLFIFDHTLTSEYSLEKECEIVKFLFSHFFLVPQMVL